MKVIFLILIAISINVHAIVSSIVSDTKSGLMWQDDEEAINTELDWDSANEYCDEYSIDGFDDWHLPTAEELLTITDKNLYDPAIKKDFNNVLSANYWSSSSSAIDDIFAWSVDFKFGRTSSPRDKMSESFVRCVRVQQYNTLSFDEILFRVLKQDSNTSVQEKDESVFMRENNETLSDFETRVKKNRAIQRTLEIAWGKPILNDLVYDQPNRTFTANLSFEANKNFVKEVTLEVPSMYWRKFKSSIHTLNKEAIFEYKNDTLKLKSVRVSYYTRAYYVDFGEDIEDKELLISSNVSKKFDEEGLHNFYELDNLLQNSAKNTIDNKKWLFVIGIEDYEYIKSVKYVKRGANLFAKTIQKKLGVPSNHSFIMIDSGATQLKIKRNLNKMLKRVTRGDTIYFYYAGWGLLSNDAKNEQYILPHDGEPTEIRDDVFFSLKNIYSRLSYSKANKIITFMDTDFSHISKDTLDINPNNELVNNVRFNQNKMVVLNATNGKTVAQNNETKAYKLFSYYLIKEIINNKKHVKSFFRSVKNQVYESSLEVQEPSIRGNMRLTL